MTPQITQTQPRQAVVTALLVTALRSASDRGSVISLLTTQPTYVAFQSRVVETIVSYDWFRFKSLKESWKHERGVSSSISDSAMCISYQKIIAMGEKALPFIFSDLRENLNKPDQWFWALRIITEENPVPDNHRGDFRAMARDWLKWAETSEKAKFLPSHLQ